MGYKLCRSRGVCVCVDRPPPVGRGHAVAGWGAGPRQVPLQPALWCPHAGGGEERGGKQVKEEGVGSPYCQKRWRPVPSYHWGRVTLMQDAETLPPLMQRWVARNRVITTLLFTYLQVCEYISFHFCARQMAMRLSFASASTPRRPYTEATKAVKCLCLFKQALRHFLFF